MQNDVRMCTAALALMCIDTIIMITLVDIAVTSYKRHDAWNDQTINCPLHNLPTLAIKHSSKIRITGL